MEQIVKDNQVLVTHDVSPEDQKKLDERELLHKYCRLNSRMTFPDAEDILKEHGADYIKKRIKKLEKRQAKTKVKPDLSTLIKGIATAYYLNDKPEMLDLIMADLQYLGFTDVTCAAKKADDYVYDHQVVFSGRHSDPEIQAVFVKTPRTDVLYQYKFEYGQLRCIPFGPTGLKEAGCNNLQGPRDLAYKISGNSSSEKPSYLAKTYPQAGKNCLVRDSYHWNTIWEAADVQLEQERKAADELAARKREVQREAASYLDKASDHIRDYILKAEAYQREFGEELPTIAEKAVCWAPGVPEVVVSATGANVPLLHVYYPQGRKTHKQEEAEETPEDSTSSE